MRLPFVVTLIGLLLSSLSLPAQEEDLLSLLGEEAPQTEYATAGFKTTRVVNGHSFEMTAPGVLDVKIAHRFGNLNGGAYELFGLDEATVRIGGDYGLTDWLMIGGGRSSVGKTFDAFGKARLLRQQSGLKKVPVSVLYLSGLALSTLKWAEPERENYFSSRLSFTHQLIIGRKFSESLSVQLMPTLVHRNLVSSLQESNDVYSLGIAGRQKISKRVAINAEYYYVPPDQLAEGFQNAFALGFDIETGGHVFQLHFTNATAMNEPGFITQTTGNWFDGDIRFGFNIARVFTLKDNRKLED